MPWKETCVMQERAKFIIDVLDGTYSMVELCDYYGISRKTGYKWLDRYQQSGIEALRDRSRAPDNHPLVQRPPPACVACNPCYQAAFSEVGCA